MKLVSPDTAESGFGFEIENGVTELDILYVSHLAEVIDVIDIT